MLSQPLAPIHLTHHSPTFPERHDDGLITTTTTTTNTLSIVYRCTCSSLTHLMKAWLCKLKFKTLKTAYFSNFSFGTSDQYFSSSIVNVICIPESPPWHVEGCVFQCTVFPTWRWPSFRENIECLLFLGVRVIFERPNYQCLAKVYYWCYH